ERKARGVTRRGSGKPRCTGSTARAQAAAGPATRRARAEKPAGQGPAGLEQVLNGASAALALLLFLFLALRPGLVPRVVARAGGLAALGAFVCLGAVAGFLGLVLGQPALAVGRGLAVLGQRREGDGGGGQGGRGTPDQASVHVSSSAAGSSAGAPGEAAGAAWAACPLYVRRACAPLNRGRGHDRGCKNGSQAA